MNVLPFPWNHDLALSWWTPKASSNAKGTHQVYKNWEAMLCFPWNTVLNLFLTFLSYAIMWPFTTANTRCSNQTKTQQESECLVFLAGWPPPHVQELSDHAGRPFQMRVDFPKSTKPTQACEDSTYGSGRAKVLSTNQGILGCYWILLICYFETTRLRSYLLSKFANPFFLTKQSVWRA